MNKMTSIFLAGCLMVSVGVQACDYEKTKKYAYDAVQDFPGSVNRLQLFALPEALQKRFSDAEKNNFKNCIGDWTGEHQAALKVCIVKHRLKAAVLSCGKSENEKANIIASAQAEARQCIEKFDAFRSCLQKYNLGGTKFGEDILDRVANKTFTA